MRIGVFGGTFNPVHYGHLLLAESARERYRLNRIVFVPAGAPPHKRHPDTASKHRLAMVRLAVRGHPAFSVSDWEIRRGRVVYTVETLAYFQRRWPRARLYFILGEDARQTLSTWRDPARLRSLSRFVSSARFTPFRSTAIRRRLRRGASIRYQVPPAVERYIRRYGLYQR